MVFLALMLGMRFLVPGSFIHIRHLPQVCLRRRPQFTKYGVNLVFDDACYLLVKYKLEQFMNHLSCFVWPHVGTIGVCTKIQSSIPMQ